MRLPLTLSTAGHAIVFALLVLLVAEPPPPQPALKGGIPPVAGATHHFTYGLPRMIEATGRCA